MPASSYIVDGLVPYAVCFGTKAEIEATTPSTEYAIGNASDFGQMNFVRGRGWSTNQLGSPSNPYPSTNTRNSAGPYNTNAVVWVVGDPVPTPYMLVNGAAGTADEDWVEMSGGSAAIAYGDLT